MEIFLATGNAHKAEEFGRMFAKARLDVRVRSAKDLGGMPYVEEISGTFNGNCRLKAEALRAIEEDGADVIVLGSTTMHQSAAYLASELPVPVLHPGQVAYKQLETLIELGLTHSKKAFPAPEVPMHANIRKGWY